MSTITAAAAEPYTTHLGDAWWYGDGLFEFLIPSEATGGLLTVFRATMPEGFSPPRHVHTREDEVFVVEDGELRFDIAGRAVAAGPGRACSCRAASRTPSGSTARPHASSGS